uniref:Putative secreted protein n=1 Tax=Panstrongylus lignarius TaxID=156445 RepID=A0A224XQQ5_9HEMI
MTCMLHEVSQILFMCRLTLPHVSMCERNTPHDYDPLEKPDRIKNQENAKHLKETYFIDSSRAIDCIVWLWILYFKEIPTISQFLKARLIFKNNTHYLECTK